MKNYGEDIGQIRQFFKIGLTTLVENQNWVFSAWIVWMCYSAQNSSYSKTIHLKPFLGFKNASHDMAKVREPCNIDPYAKIVALFMTILCVHMYSTH